jgi:hypothetical protein
MGEMRNAFMNFIRKLEGERPLERPRRRWEDNIKMDKKEKNVGGYRLDSCGLGW